MAERKIKKDKECAILRFFKKISLLCKEKFEQLFTLGTINVLVSIIISVSIEFFRQILILAFGSGTTEYSGITRDDLINIFFSSEIANICLITILVWCITGCIRLLSGKNERERPLWLTILVFIGLVLSTGWYIIEVIFSNNGVIVTFISCGLLFLLLLIYFSERRVKTKDDNTDYCVAPQPQK